MSKDKYGYKHENGEYSKMTGSSSGNACYSRYDKRPDADNKNAIHVNVNAENKSFTIVEHDDKGNTTSSSGSCYLTTAVMKNTQEEFDDNCYYLDMLRWFRDNYVSEEDKKHYYEIAPIVVDVINKLEYANSIYKEIYEKVIQVCVRAIELGKYDMVYDLYKKSVLDLEQKYVKQNTLILA